MSSDDVDFLARLQEAALRARASGFEATAEAIEAIVLREVERQSKPRAARTDGAGAGKSVHDR